MKVKDLTLGQIKEICDKREQCVGDIGENDACPFISVCGKCFSGVYAWTTEDMERDIEGVNK